MEADRTGLLALIDGSYDTQRDSDRKRCIHPVWTQIILKEVSSLQSSPYVKYQITGQLLPSGIFEL